MITGNSASNLLLLTLIIYLLVHRALDDIRASIDGD